jgi:hypothetical protein
MNQDERLSIAVEEMQYKRESTADSFFRRHGPICATSCHGEQGIPVAGANEYPRKTHRRKPVEALRRSLRGNWPRVA